MKKWMLLWTLALGLGACSEKEGQKAWDADAMISLRAAKTAPTANSRAEGHLTPREIVEQAWAIVNDSQDVQPVRGFADAQRDLVNERLLMWGTDIINSRLEYNPAFLEGKNTVLTLNRDPSTAWHTDTIAYIPNRVLEAAQAIIKPAFERGDYETCYEAFDKASPLSPSPAPNTAHCRPGAKTDPAFRHAAQPGAKLLIPRPATRRSPGPNC